MLLIMSAAVTVAVLRTDMFRLWRVPISPAQLQSEGKDKRRRKFKVKRSWQEERKKEVRRSGRWAVDRL